MIENLFGGGGGGTVDTVVAGTGISVNSTDPANPIITNTSLNTDEVAKVSSNDTTAGYLNGKLVAGSGITLTENNNGGNETLSITLGSHTHAASDITSGVIATARLGSGTASATTFLAGDQSYKTPPYPVTSVAGKTGAVTLTNTDVGAAATSHTHAASDITSGVIATARLGSGTADATTYLAGDQTYKAAVTSVNGSTGAVTVAAGDTTYTVTTADVENTTTKTKIASFTVPANTWSDGQTVELTLWTNSLNNSGTSNLTLVMETQGTGMTTRTSAIGYIGIISTVRAGQNILRWTRYGTSVVQNHWNTGNLDSLFYMGVTNPFSSSFANHYSSSTSVNFATNITLDVYATLGTANAAYYVRVEAARAVKYNGGNV